MDSKQFSLINCVQKIVIYETKARYYVVGSNNTESRFRVLKIDRTEAKELNIVDDKVEYTQREVRDLLRMIDEGNRPKQQQKGSNGLTRIVSAFAIVGFVRFLEGYYIVLVTKRRKIALIGPHTIYKVEDTNMIYIPNDIATRSYSHPDEQRYVKMFQNVDLSSNFYFSYSFDLTHTLQYNMAPCKGVEKSPDGTENSREEVENPQTPNPDIETPDTEENNLFSEKKEKLTTAETDEIESAEEKVADVFQDKSTDTETPKGGETSKKKSSLFYGVRTPAADKFVWNTHLLKKVKADLHIDWVVCLIHGFVGQSKLAVFGKPIYVTLIARRSSKFAGTRFLKRGANAEGYVANEVETEQIVQDASISSLHKCRITSLTQVRGSLPLHWSQDISTMVPKPQILIDQCDPYGFVAGQHFNQLLSRYGAPVILLNLVKKREKKKQESTLTPELLGVLQYLNQFLPPQHSIKYIGFDMARVSKSKDTNVLHRLAEIAEHCVKMTGFFATGPQLHCNTLRPHPKLPEHLYTLLGLRGLRIVARGVQSCPSGRLQQGVVRTNCVDCLDRTNTAQFAIGKCALGLQLHAMGLLHDPTLRFETDCVRMLEDLYEDHGDTLALQYGGSQLVHRIKGYRKVAPWTSSSKDTMQTLSRYYSNAFADADKQQAMNLFLGVYIPNIGQANIWELPTDFYLHNPPAKNGPKPRKKSYSQWWDLDVYRSLPLAYEEVFKGTNEGTQIVALPKATEAINMYWEHYRPYELTVLDEHYASHMSDTIRDFMPKGATSYSPFALRVRQGRRQEEHGLPAMPYVSEIFMTLGKSNSTIEANPNVSGKDSTVSLLSTGSNSDSGSSSSSDGSDIEGDLVDMIDNDNMAKEESGLSMVSLKDLFPTMAQTYGVEINAPPTTDIKVYKKFSEIGLKSHQPLDTSPAEKRSTNLVQTSIFPLDSFLNVEPPTVNTKSKDIYRAYITCGKRGATEVSSRNQAVYEDYLRTNFL